MELITFFSPDIIKKIVFFWVIHLSRPRQIARLLPIRCARARKICEACSIYKCFKNNNIRSANRWNNEKNYNELQIL